MQIGEGVVILQLQRYNEEVVNVSQKEVVYDPKKNLVVAAI